MDAESGRQATSGHKRRLVAASLAVLGVGAIAVAGTALFQNNDEMGGTTAVHARTARQIGTVPGFIYNGVWYPLNPADYNPVAVSNSQSSSSSQVNEEEPDNEDEEDEDKDENKDENEEKDENEDKDEDKDEDEEDNQSTSTRRPKPTTTRRPQKTEDDEEQDEEETDRAPQNNVQEDDGNNPSPPKPDMPKVSKGGANGGKSNIATAAPDNLYSGQNGPARTSDEGPCSCSGAVIGNTCYATVAQAVGRANSGDTVAIGGKKTITDVLGFKTKSLTFEGVTCSGQKATLEADMNEPTGAILMATGNNQQITLKDLVFTRSSGSGFAAGFRGIRKGQYISLDIVNCDFRNLKTKAMGGSAIYVPLVKGTMTIDGSSTFSNNIVDTACDFKKNDKFCEYGGGGALFVNEVRRGNALKLDGTWRENHHYFQHGLGGAACIEYAEGEIDITGRFIENTASDGAGVHIGGIPRSGVVNVDGYFQGNHAIDYGVGCRGAAVRPWFIEGEFNADGTYVDNVSDGRGAVFATNRVRKSGKVTIKGTYRNNKAYGYGTVFSATNQFSGSLLIDGSSSFSGNYAFNPNYNILGLDSENFFSFGESQWDNQDFTYN